MFNKKDKQLKSATRGLPYQVKITHLDNTSIEYRFDKSTTGGECLLHAASEFKILKHDYFSLKFKSLRGKRRWLYMNKSIKKQLEKYSLDGLADASLSLEVKFFPISVHLIQDEVTRYLFYLQLKMDVLDGRLSCSRDEAIKLAAYSVQAENGDHDPDKHSPPQLCELNLLPEKHCKMGELNKMLREISGQHKMHKGMGPSLSEQNYLKITQNLSDYGQEGFEVIDDSGDKLTIGACAIGIFVNNFIGKPLLYMKWEELRRVTCKDKYFGVESRKDKETILFNTTDPDVAKYIMWCVSEQNQFFLKQSQEVVNMHTTSPPNNTIGMFPCVSEELLRSNTTRTADLSPTPLSLQHASSTMNFPTNSTNPVMSRYHSDHNMNSPVRNCSPGKKLINELNSPSKQPGKYSSPLRRPNSKGITRPINKPEKRNTTILGRNSIENHVNKHSNRLPPFATSSPVPVLLGFRRLSCEDITQTQNESQPSLPSSRRSSGSFNHFSFTSSPVPDTPDTSTGAEPSPSTCKVIYEREEDHTLSSLISPEEIKKLLGNSGICQPSDTNHSHISKTISVPVVDSDNNSPLPTAKRLISTLPRRKPQSDAEINQRDEIVRSNTEISALDKPIRTHRTNDYLPTDKFKSPSDTRLVLPRKSSSLAQRSISDDPVKYYKFLASLFKRKHEAWCTDEFSHIKSEKHSVTHAKKPENINKNRNRDILPYNNSRVKLEVMNNTESSDYINASHIVYIVKDKNYHFIAAQSPMAHTCTNFWQMIWEQNVRVIAMLNEGTKDGINPAHIYFPASSDPNIDDCVQFDQYKISIRSYQEKGAFLFRLFSLKHIPTGQTREVCHLQFMEWVDDDSPKNYDGFQSYLDYTKGILSKHTTPLLVHCNFGIGPSGVFILVYLLQEHIKLQEVLHVQNVLSILCSQRMELVATNEQFKFVYFAMYKYTQYLLTMEERHTLI